MIAINLKTEYLTDPTGIDLDRPRLFWNCEGGTIQSAYQIMAVDDTGALLWDSGKVKSSSMRVRWGEESVPTRTTITWKVRLWDEQDEAGNWAEARFETGLPKGEPWTAQWIAGDYAPRKKDRYPVDCFRKRFTVSQAQKARLYITACGLYGVKLNGARVGNFVLAPGHTDYRKRVQYQSYDVTELLKAGENVLTVQLADGWYRGSCGAWGLRNQYGTQTKLLAQLELTAAEYKLLRFFMEQPDIILSTEQIMGKLWDCDGNFVDSNTLAVYIRRLRAKIEDDPTKPTRIVTVRRMGYKWSAGGGAE